MPGTMAPQCHRRQLAARTALGGRNDANWTMLLPGEVDDYYGADDDDDDGVARASDGDITQQDRRLENNGFKRWSAACSARRHGGGRPLGGGGAYGIRGTWRPAQGSKPGLLMSAAAEKVNCRRGSRARPAPAS